MTNPIYRTVINFITIELNSRNNCHLELLPYFRNQMNPRTGELGKCPTPAKSRPPGRQLSNSPQLRDWCQWAHFCSVRDYSLWIQTSNPAANVSIFEFAIWLGISVSSPGCISNRLWRVSNISTVWLGFPDFGLPVRPPKGSSVGCYYSSTNPTGQVGLPNRLISC